ncbi:hypothetical protein BLNAU_10538 [Blattamonas nauphoetae]|uniref:Uncharacterized protein n=1 Tax=Blattamonas nauphoetae TaxID=2049346 RepID=A0ABQ9XQ43_9EUKA|nr:hypothetical protein BLNAU_10538 [Blattamonas nauphoetae]
MLDFWRYLTTRHTGPPPDISDHHQIQWTSPDTLDPCRQSADAFLGEFASNSDESSTNFVQFIVVLVSSASQIISTATMKMLENLISWCSAIQGVPD